MEVFTEDDVGSLVIDDVLLSWFVVGDVDGLRLLEDRAELLDGVVVVGRPCSCAVALGICQRNR